MIEIYTGKPGAGKTYVGCVLRIIEELERGNRHIVTNASVDLAALNAYFQVKGRKFVDVFTRVRLITREEAGEFWRFRGDYTVLPQGGTKDVETVDKFSRGRPGCMYVIDEAHVLFDARKWAKSAEALTFYNSQHRKFEDLCIFVTQFLKLLEVRVRGFAEFFHVLKNFAGVNFMTVLRMPKRMRELVYSTEPGPGVPVEYEVWHPLNAEKANCYDTTAGVGIGGGRKPEERKARGLALPWWMVFVGFAAAAVAFYYGVKAVGHGVGKGFSEIGSVAKQRLEGEKAASTPPAKGSSVDSLPPPSLPEAKTESRPPPVSVRGIAFVKGSPVVYLSDGRVLEAPELQQITRSEVVAKSGERFLRNPPRLSGSEAGKSS